jgi:hypothetical protein
MLDGVGRSDALQRLYCSARLPPLLALWDGYAAGTPFATWLPGFYEQVGGSGGCCVCVGWGVCCSSAIL